MATRTETTATLADLPAGTLCLIVSYLSLWDKQAIVQVATNNGAFTTAVQVETRHLLLGHDGDIPEGMNLNNSLNFVSRHCPNLQQFSLHVPGTFLCAEDDFGGQWFTPDDDPPPPPLLQGRALDRAIQGCRGALKSFRLSFEEGFDGKIRSLIGDHNCLEALGKCELLEVMDCRFLFFQYMNQLVSLTNSLPRSLVILKLDDLQFPDLDWSSSELLAKAIAGFSRLEQLSLASHRLHDDDIIGILGEHSQHLRSLVLSGRRMRSEYDHTCYLTDFSMEKISQCCTNLVHLDVSNNFHITQLGIRSVLQSCPLQEIATHSCNIASADWQDLVTLSSSLLLVAWGPPPPSRDLLHMINGISAAIAASEGRVVFYETSSFGVIQLDLDPNTNEQDPTIIEGQNDSLGRIRELIELQKHARNQLFDTSFYLGPSRYFFQT